VKKVLVVGTGEIGSAIISVLGNFPEKFEIFKKDVEDIDSDKIKV